MHLHVKRYKPVYYSKCDGYMLPADMKTSSTGDYVSFEDYENLRRDFMKLHEHYMEQGWELTMIRNPFQN